MALQPLIAICGTTGVGKSKLAVELALAVGGKVINADAMQVYRGLDILTNKLRADEQRGVEHALMNFKKPGEQYVVGEWVRDARREIDRSWSEGKIPIVVGGTSYWIHHLLFPSGLPAQAGPSKELSSPPSPALLRALDTLPDKLASLYCNLPSVAPSAKVNPDESFALHNLLSHLDPPMASRWHWRDTRKVLRNLEIIRENGQMASEVLSKTHSKAAEKPFRSLIFWLYSEPNVLNPRLEERVDDMLSGVLDEIRSLDLAELGTSEHLDFTVGIFQAIGFKEFHNYLLREESDDRLYAQAISEMKLNTIKYARRQVKWIRNKLLPAVEATRREDENSSNKLYLLDATDLSLWDEHVLHNAKDISEMFLTISVMPDPISLSETGRRLLSVADLPTNPSDVLLVRRKIVCPTCTTKPDRPVMLEEGREWEVHQRTASHRRIKRRCAIESATT